MLQLTSAAAIQVAHARDARGLAETVGLRVFSERRTGGGASLNLIFAEVPAEDDLVTEHEGTRIFIASDVFDRLAKATLDAQETADGVKLILRSC
jgi:Fe-S cluster assembly iron-binding protein IscA